MMKISVRWFVFKEPDLIYFTQHINGVNMQRGDRCFILSKEEFDRYCAVLRAGVSILAKNEVVPSYEVEFKQL